eukprot:NODE_756_length_1806_cov_71.355720_g616_i0.p2 GENE.NODE_756_length_1806_cov_71.355720_g616_i0~~NODE_756_length_1806_cov_71.355720_g616_i0.p2  ORF type:complete len:572 (-),score=232.12 NODE_756_length_1806_cov_71.355720_g616_i0:90-1667(-)
MGLVAVLEFQKNIGQSIEGFPTNPWLAYGYFHLGDYESASTVYREMIEHAEKDGEAESEKRKMLHVYLGCCFFFLGQYKEAEEEAQKGPVNTLQNRLLFHAAQKQGDEAKLMMYHQKLQETLEDQLCLASIHFLRNHWQEATEIYKRILLENRDFLALNLYIALCYYKMDYYDVSIEVLNVYLASYPDSATAINLKACNNYRLYNGKAAEVDLKPLLDLQSTYVGTNIYVKHNQVVFQGGERALQVLPPLIEVLPEARLNLVIFHLKNDEVQEAYELIKHLDPQTPQEYILKGVVNASIGQMTDSRDHIRMAEQYFQLVGASAAECDTIPGRQCMASCFFLLKQFEDVLTYLRSIQQYFENDDTFNFNFGLACGGAGAYDEGRQGLMKIRDPKIRSEFVYLSWLARCHIYSREPKKAWELYLKMDTSGESFSILQLIANDCYKVGLFFYSAKAFDVLERLDPAPEYWDGKRGACVGVFQLVVANKESPDTLRDVLGMLRNTSNPQVESIMRAIKNWAKTNSVKLA